MTRNSLTCLALLATLFGCSPAQEEASKSLRVVPEDLQPLVSGNNEFAFDLFRLVSAKEANNIVISPYSISSALAMTYAGTRDQTADKFAKALHFTLPPQQLHSAFGFLSADLRAQEKDSKYQMHVANALWGQKGLPYYPEFLELTARHYGAGRHEVDFAAKTEEARETINAWVEEKTKNKIKKLLQPKDVGPATKLVLTNAIYFRAFWKAPFHKEQTQDRPFELASGEQVRVPMMQHHEREWRYFEGDGLKWLELPYQGDRLSMVLLLPQHKGSLSQLEKVLSALHIQQGLQKLQPQKGLVTIPRFKVTYRLSLLGQLVEMGMPTGPLSAITSLGPLEIHKVIHKAFIEVDEVGTEAAAATAVIIGDLGYPRFSFIADHPFLFVIRDAQTGCILFQGRVSDPRS